MSTLATVAETTAQKTLNPTGVQLSTIELARLSGRRHAHILRSVERMNEDLIQMGKQPVAVCEYKDSTGRTLPMYHLTKYQCELLAMALSGEARIRVLDRLYEMEKKEKTSLLPVDLSSIDVYNPEQVSFAMWSMAELANKMSHKLRESRKNIEELQSMTPQAHLQAFIDAQVDQKIALIAPKTYDDTHTTIKGFCSMNKIRLTDSEAKSLSYRARKICEQRGIEVRKLNDARFGYLNLYPREVIEQAYEEK